VRVAALILVSLSFVAGSLPAAEDADVESHVKAAYIYNFARFVEWPARAGAGPVRIGVLGHGDLAPHLEEVVRGKSVNGRSIEVTHVSAASEGDCCQILIIERSESKRLKDVTQALAVKPVLTVSDCGGGIRDGVIIGFRMVDESVRFQISQEAAERAGLRISSQLLKVALPADGKLP